MGAACALPSDEDATVGADAFEFEATPPRDDTVALAPTGGVGKLSTHLMIAFALSVPKSEDLPDPLSGEPLGFHLRRCEAAEEALAATRLLAAATALILENLRDART